MIKITVIGNTYPIRSKLNDCGFEWKSQFKEWWMIEGEASLNSAIEKIRPPFRLNITVILTQVDIQGNKINEREVKIQLRERADADYLKLFNEHMKQHVQIITHDSDESASSPETGGIDDDFY